MQKHNLPSESLYVFGCKASSSLLLPPSDREYLVDELWHYVTNPRHAGTMHIPRYGCAMVLGIRPMNICQGHGSGSPTSDAPLFGGFFFGVGDRITPGHHGLVSWALCGHRLPVVRIRSLRDLVSRACYFRMRMYDRCTCHRPVEQIHLSVSTGL